MVNPLKLLKLYTLINKMQGVTEETAPMNVKIPQLVHLFVSAAGIIALPTFADGWLHQKAHLTEYIVAVAISLLLHAISPNIFGGPSDQAQQDTGMASKTGMFILLMLGLGAVTASAQTTPVATPAAPTPMIYAAGASYSPGASPAVAGTVIGAYQLIDGTYAFTAIDAVPTSVNPLSVTSNIGVGVAQKVYTLNVKTLSIPIIMPTSAGISWTGQNTGFQWNGGVLAAIPIKPGSKYSLMPNVRFLKSNISNSSYQVIVGILFGVKQ